MDQVGEVVLQLVRTSFGSQSYDKALDAVVAYRKAAIVVRPRWHRGAQRAVLMPRRPARCFARETGRRTKPIGSTSS